MELQIVRPPIKNNICSFSIVTVGQDLFIELEPTSTMYELSNTEKSYYV